MKNLFFSLLLLCTNFAVAAPNPADYNITVHVIASKNRPGSPPSGYQYLNVIIDGKKYELSGAYPGALKLGDYKARLKKVKQWNDYDIETTYEFLMPDGKTRYYGLSGFPE